jgi:hypothetical protein
MPNVEPPGGVEEGDAVELAQAVFANWREGQLAHCPAGYRMGLGTWSLLDEQALVGLEGWLQLGTFSAGSTKHVFGRLEDGRLLFGRVCALEGPDDLGRENGRFWAHALVTRALLAAWEGSSPLEWLKSLPFFESLEEAVAAAADDRGSLRPLGWRPPRPPAPRDGLPGLDDAVALAWTCSRGGKAGAAGGADRPVWRLPSEASPSWEAAAEAYRVIAPEGWGMLGVDTRFDGVHPDPQRRRYWVVGTAEPGTDGRCPAVGSAGLGPVGRWAVAWAGAGRWAEAVHGVRSAHQAMDVIASGAPAPGWTARAPEGLLDHAGGELVAAVRRDLVAEAVAEVEVALALEGLGPLAPADLGERWAAARQSGRYEGLVLSGLLGLEAGGEGRDQGFYGRLAGEKGVSAVFEVWALVTSGRGVAQRRVPPELPRALAELPAELYVSWAEWVAAKAVPCRPELVVPALPEPGVVARGGQRSPATERQWEERVLRSWRLARARVGPEALGGLAEQWAVHLEGLGGAIAGHIAAALREEAQPGEPGPGEQRSRGLSQRARGLLARRGLGRTARQQHSQGGRDQ